MKIVDKTLKANIKSYLKGIKKELPCSSNTKSAFISIFKKRIDEYLEDNPTATFEDIQNEFGTPESVANAFDPNEYSDALKSRKKKVLILVIALVALVAALSITTVALIDALNDNTIQITDDF